MSVNVISNLIKKVQYILCHLKKSNCINMISRVSIMVPPPLIYMGLSGSKEQEQPRRAPEMEDHNWSLLLSESGTLCFSSLAEKTEVSFEVSQKTSAISSLTTLLYQAKIKMISFSTLSENWNEMQDIYLHRGWQMKLLIDERPWFLCVLHYENFRNSYCKFVTKMLKKHVQ